jgi:hypothetical protein
VKVAGNPKTLLPPVITVMTPLAMKEHAEGVASVKSISMESPATIKEMLRSCTTGGVGRNSGRSRCPAHTRIGLPDKRQ